MYSCARLSLLFLGFLHASLYQQVDSSPPDHVNLSEPTPVWNTLIICPTVLTNAKTTWENFLSVVGKGNGLSFTIQIAEDASEIALDEPHTVNVHGGEVSMFQFIPPKGISVKQLDITATSQSTVAAYLKVSQNCKEVDLQKDLESINYKKESLRLSFATKGRITLSRVSIPPLTDSASRWFIGIGLKNLSGDIKLSESKNVTLKLTRSFDYNYVTPICTLVIGFPFVGIGVSVIAYFLFEESLTKVNVGEDVQGNNNADLTCCGFIVEMLKVISYHWFSFGPKTFSYITGIVGNVLMVGAFQFVFANWYTMIQEGDRDNCYYNDFCYRVANHDIPFNLMISNLTYIVHGLILVVWVMMLETKKVTVIKGRYSFSIAYALAWALVFQGLFSALYHLCPGVYTFQFDSVFMFIIAGLILVLLYNEIEQDHSQNEKYTVSASYFFLFFITSVVGLNYFASRLYWNSGVKNMMFFYAIPIIWWCVMFFGAFLKSNMPQKCRSDNGEDKVDALLFILGGLVIPGAIFKWYLFSDPAQAVLLACIACSFVATLAKAMRSKDKFGKHLCKCTFQVIFMIVTVIISSAAVRVFIWSPTTNKTLSPENSRDQNKECVILGFFDWHDLWHFLSSFALLMGVFVVMFISSEAEQSPQAETRGKNESEARGRN